MSGLDQNGRRLFNLIGHMVDLFELLRQPALQHRKPCCMVDGASLSSVHVERFKQHNDGSSLCACRGNDLQQSPSGCFRVPLLAPNTGAKGKAYREPAALVEHRLRLFERKFCSLHALPGDRLL
ncbi:hypothetical protein [Mesorhizobium silamurunense]|uniref:hypothetical protein n=1 Tax=Mesorhizobium silamurunense TaxID=499528 RepID=UPI00177F6C88|nr:hypothetical protein [Mesorhizobium silamurunense]